MPLVCSYRNFKVALITSKDSHTTCVSLAFETSGELSLNICTRNADISIILECIKINIFNNIDNNNLLFDKITHKKCRTWDGWFICSIGCIANTKVLIEVMQCMINGAQGCSFAAYQKLTKLMKIEYTKDNYVAGLKYIIDSMDKNIEILITGRDPFKKLTNEKLEKIVKNLQFDYKLVDSNSNLRSSIYISDWSARYHLITIRSNYFYVAYFIYMLLKQCSTTITNYQGDGAILEIGQKGIYHRINNKNNWNNLINKQKIEDIIKHYTDKCSDKKSYYTAHLMNKEALVHTTTKWIKFNYHEIFDDICSTLSINL